MNFNQHLRSSMGSRSLLSDSHGETTCRCTGNMLRGELTSRDRCVAFSWSGLSPRSASFSLMQDKHTVDRDPSDCQRILGELINELARLRHHGVAGRGSAANPVFSLVQHSRVRVGVLLFLGGHQRATTSKPHQAPPSVRGGRG